MDNAIYLAVFRENDGGLTARVPELNVSVKGKSIEETLPLVREAIARKLFSDNSDKERKILTKCECKEDEFAAIIDIDLVKYRRAFDNRRVRKNLTIPNWLNEEAEKQDINFSRVLEEAIKRKLNCTD